MSNFFAEKSTYKNFFKNFAVFDSSHFIKFFGVPSKIISPPSLPPPGPISIIQSACEIISSRCSTIITVLFFSTNFLKSFIRCSARLKYKFFRFYSIHSLILFAEVRRQINCLSVVPTLNIPSLLQSFFLKYF